MPNFERDRDDEWQCKHCGRWHDIQIGPPGMYCGCPESREADREEQERESREYRRNYQANGKIVKGRLVIEFESFASEQAISDLMRSAVNHLIFDANSGEIVQGSDYMANQSWIGQLIYEDK